MAASLAVVKSPRCLILPARDTDALNFFPILNTPLKFVSLVDVTSFLLFFRFNSFKIFFSTSWFVIFENLIKKVQFGCWTSFLDGSPIVRFSSLLGRVKRSKALYFSINADLCLKPLPVLVYSEILDFFLQFVLLLSFSFWHFVLFFSFLSFLEEENVLERTMFTKFCRTFSL